jgi:glutamate synthase (NADPH/NADH) small chain
MEKGFSMDQALAEASRCLLCHDAPCSKGCPAATEPDRFIRKLRFRNLKGAVAVVRDNNILGGVCGAICPTSSLCEEGCLASGITTPIRIGKIQRFLVEYGWQVGFKPLSSNPSSGRKIGIVGAGPSGLSCAAELAREGYQVVIFEKLARPGGMLRYVIPEHRLSREFVDREIADVFDLGVKIECNAPIETQVDLDQLLKDGFDALYVATGAWKCTKIDVPSANSDAIFDALSFLQIAKTDSQEFTSLVKAKEVAVIGGGDSAMDSAVTAQRNGAKDVYLIYRRSYQEMPASEEAKRHALSEGVHFIIMTQPVNYLTEAGKVKGLKVVRCKLGEIDKSRRRSPILIEETEHTLHADLIVEAAGLEPDDSVRQFSNLEFDDSNRIIIEDENGTTSIKRVFAGGDAVRGASLVAKAVGDGKRAAAAIQRMLGKPIGGPDTG